MEKIKAGEKSAERRNYGFKWVTEEGSFEKKPMWVNPKEVGE